MAIQGFWADKKKDDAVAIVKDGLSRLDALDKMLAAPAPDQMAAQAAAKEFQGARAARATSSIETATARPHRTASSQGCSRTSNRRAPREGAPYVSSVSRRAPLGVPYLFQGCLT